MGKRWWWEESRRMKVVLTILGVTVARSRDHVPFPEFATFLLFIFSSSQAHIARPWQILHLSSIPPHCDCRIWIKKQ